MAKSYTWSQTDTTTFSIRIPTELKAELEELAIKERRSMSMMTAIIIERELERLKSE